MSGREGGKGGAMEIFIFILLVIGAIVFNGAVSQVCIVLAVGGILRGLFSLLFVDDYPHGV